MSTSVKKKKCGNTGITPVIPVFTRYLPRYLGDLGDPGISRFATGQPVLDLFPRICFDKIFLFAGPWRRCWGRRRPGCGSPPWGRSTTCPPMVHPPPLLSPLPWARAWIEKALMKATTSNVPPRSTARVSTPAQREGKVLGSVHIWRPQNFGIFGPPPPCPHRWTEFRGLSYKSLQFNCSEVSYGSL